MAMTSSERGKKYRALQKELNPSFREQENARIKETTYGTPEKKANKLAKNAAIRERHKQNPVKVAESQDYQASYYETVTKPKRQQKRAAA